MDSTKEFLLNTKLAEYLRQAGLQAFEEQTLHQPIENGKPIRHQVDVLVDVGEYAVALEAEFAPKNGENDAIYRLTDPPLQWRGLPVGAAYAVQYPGALQSMLPPDAYQNLRETNDLGILYLTKEPGQEPRTEAVLNDGSVDRLAELLHDYWARSDNGSNVDTVVAMTSEAIERSSAVLNRLQEAGDEAGDPAATKSLVWLNALLFQELLSRKLDPNALPHSWPDRRIPRPDTDGGVQDLLDQWKRILSVNWFPIFFVARESLKKTPVAEAKRATDILKRAATRIAENDVVQRHDIAGRIFHRLLESRKFLATNYTTIPAAILLAALAFDESHPLWEGRNLGNVQSLQNLRVVDPACGSGTLLMAALQEIVKQVRRESTQGTLAGTAIKTILENSLYGFDVVPGAIHLAASTLAMAETGQLIADMQLWRMQHGVYAGQPRLGSLDMLSTSPTRGNAGRLPFLEAGADAALISGHGERDAYAADFPADCDLVIANPPYTRAGGPGHEKNTKWNPIFGSLPDTAEQELMKKALNRTLRNTPAGVYAGLGSAFLVLADENIRHGGRLAFVLPATAITGSSWEPIRKLLLDKYQIDWVVSSHDPNHRPRRGGIPGRIFSSFSESTEISEILLVATKQQPASRHLVRFVNLRNNPTETVEALSMAQSLLSLPENQTEVRGSGGKIAGEINLMLQANLTAAPWINNAFVQSRLIGKARTLVENNELEGHGIPLSRLDQEWTLGPYHMQIKNPRQGLFEIDEYPDRLRRGFPALWHHKANCINQLTVPANAWLTPKTPPR